VDFAQQRLTLTKRLEQLPLPSARCCGTTNLKMHHAPFRPAALPRRRTRRVTGSHRLVPRLPQRFTPIFSSLHPAPGD